MKKFLSLFIALIICFSSLTTTFASEVENGEVNNSSGMVDDPGNLSNLENGEDNGGESSTEVGEGDSSSEPSEGDGGLTLEPLEPVEPEEPTEEPTEPTEGSEAINQNITVDVSENSIQAIADAVTSIEDDNAVTITLNNGTVLTIPDTFMDKWNSSEYHFVYLHRGTNTSYWRIVAVPSLNKLSGFLNGSNGWQFSYSNCDIYTNNPESVSNGNDSTIVNRILYSDFNIINDEGLLLYQSDTTKVYTVSFDTGFDDLILDPVSSFSFVAPDITYDGYKFEGWYLDEDFTMPYVSSYEFYQNTTLYAKWTAYVTISFVTNVDDYTLDSIKVLSGTAYTPSDFAYSGYTYYGAYTDENFENQFVSGTEITTDITLYLRFEPVVYDVGELLTRQVELSEGLQVMQGQLWIILIVGLLYFVYRFFRIFF